MAWANEWLLCGHRGPQGATARCFRGGPRTSCAASGTLWTGFAAAEPLACPPGMSDCPPSSSSRTCAPGKDNCAHIHRTGFGCGVQADKQRRLNPGTLPPQQPSARSLGGPWVGIADRHSHIPGIQVMAEIAMVVVARTTERLCAGATNALPLLTCTVAQGSGGTGLPARVEPKPALKQCSCCHAAFATQAERCAAAAAAAERWCRTLGGAVPCRAGAQSKGAPRVVCSSQRVGWRRE